MPLKKNMLVCPNPLFLIWLEEWKKEAEDRDLNSKWTYAKALASIKRYPLPLRSGKEAKILENVSDGIANRLDERLKQYLDDGGDPVYLHKIDPVLEAESSWKENNLKKYVCKYRSGPYALILTLFQESQNPSTIGYMSKIDLQMEAQPLCDKSFTVSDAGSYYTAWSSMGTLIKKGYVLKKRSPAQYSITESGSELAQRLLQGTHELSDNTFNSLKQSIASNSPQKTKTNNQNKLKNIHSHRLGDSSTSGISQVTNVLAQIRKDNFQVVKSPKKLVNPSSTITSSSMITNDKNKITSPNKKFTTKSKAMIVDHIDHMNSSSITNNIGMSHNLSTELNYWYVTDSGSVTVTKSKAFVNIDETLGVGFLIKIKKCDLEKSGKLFKLDKTKQPVDGFVYAYIADKDSEEIAYPPKLESSPSKFSNASILTIVDVPSKPIEKDSSSLVDINAIIDMQMKRTQMKCHRASLSSGGNSVMDKINVSKKGNMSPKKVPIKSDSLIFSNNKISKKESNNILQALTDESQLKTKSTNESCALAKNISIGTTITTTSITSTSLKRQNVALPINEGKIKVSKPNPPEIICGSEDSTNMDFEPLFILYPGSFDVVLCVDIIETSGTGRRKKELSDKLFTSGIQIDIRKLQLGDYLWIAKEKNGSKRELVLDFIIERKRMDDLAGSIVDGRFREQKFRLKNCALKKPIYLIEKYGSMEHLPLPEKTLQQAITNTQVIDGFFVKETKDIYDSADYLTLMTSQLSSLYSNKTLYALTMDMTREFKMEKDHEDLVQQNIQYFMTFEEFSLETTKNKVLTVSELFAKQLMQIKGVSPERALAIIEKYPTPLSLVNSYESLTSQSEKENLLTNIQFGKGKRKVGAAISIQVYIMYSKLNVS